MQLELKQEAFRIETLVKHMQAECFEVCVPTLKSDELTAAEVRCLERCGHKYLQANKVVHESLMRAMGSGGLAADQGGKRR